MEQPCWYDVREVATAVVGKRTCEAGRRRGRMEGQVEALAKEAERPIEAAEGHKRM